jgi:hypothetical protein
MSTPGWRELLSKPGETIVSAWVGGRELRSGVQTWTIDGRLPRQEGWYRFGIEGRRARVKEAVEPETDSLRHLCRGYLVGDRLVGDEQRIDPDPSLIVESSETVHLLDRGLGRFVRIVAGRLFDGGPLVFKHQDMPLGAEDAVLAAYLARAESVGGIANVPPALDAAFRMESWMRVDTERRRAEAEAARKAEAERLEREERNRQLATQTGTSEGRRALAAIDFGAAARAALALTGAEYLDHQPSYNPNEMVVTYRHVRRTLVCTCDAHTLRIIDAGICLRDYRRGTKGDQLFSLESLPSVVAEAERRGILVVERRPDGWRGDPDHEDFGGERDDDE